MESEVIVSSASQRPLSWLCGGVVPGVTLWAHCFCCGRRLGGLLLWQSVRIGRAVARCFVALFATACGSATVQPAPPEEPMAARPAVKGAVLASIPFRHVGGYIVVEGRIEGEAESVRLAVDTGSGPGLYWASSRVLPETVTLSLGPLTLPRLPVRAEKRPEYVRAFERHDLFAGIIGFDLFVQGTAEIDFDRETIEITQRLTRSTPQSGVEVRLERYHSKPWVWLEIDTGARRPRYSVIVDTGFPLDARVSPERDCEEFGPSITAGQASLRGRYPVRLSRLPSIRIGDAIVKDALVSCMRRRTIGSGDWPSAPPVLGLGFLRRFKVTLDYAGGRMYLQRRSGWVELTDYDMSGLVLKAHESGAFEIHDVVPGTAADRAGVWAGDLLLAIDGRDASALSAADVYDLFWRGRGEVRRLAIRRADEPVMIELTIEPRI